MGDTADTIPNYLTAATLQELRRLMFLNNIKSGMFYKYFDIQFVKGKWYAFYFEKLDTSNAVNIMELK